MPQYPERKRTHQKQNFSSNMNTEEIVLLNAEGREAYKQLLKQLHKEKVEEKRKEISKKIEKQAELFNGAAQRAAQIVAENRRSNKPTQLRKFYDEIVMWDQKISMHPDKFDEYLPFIRMLNAKVAYAKGRNNLVDDNFMILMSHCLEQVQDAHSMHTFKTFMEAFMGFYKVERPKD